MTAVDYLFAVCAVFGGAMFVVRLILLLVGGVHDMGVEAHVGDVDVSGVDVHDVHVETEAHGADISFKLLTVQGITAFFMMFGLVGLAMRRSSHAAELVSILVAFAVGMVSLYGVAKLFALMRGLQSSGTLDLRNAIGQVGTVYLTIPPRGTGKVQIAVQDRLQTLEATTESSEEIKTGQRVRVVGLGTRNLLIVERL